MFLGVTTVLKNMDREWLVIIHCMNHRLELAMKDSYKADPSFQRIGKDLIVIWATFRLVFVVYR